jgi:hypothetical protein
MTAASLENLQASVERHFDNLAKERRAVGLPVFALEHGLSKTQVNEISQGLRRHIVLGGTLSPFWLLWVVYATELGYDFDGEEYWQSYEKRTPQWTEDSHRRQALRRCFENFESKYGGPTPTGPWARQFSIIAWPITHAVLPRDLQSQMARTLFVSRHEIAEATDQAAPLLGALIARQAGGASSRFRNFLEHEELTGRIAKALLFPDADELNKVLTPATLSRIVSDLETSWQSKSWLSAARKVAKEVRILLEFKRSGNTHKFGRPDVRDGPEIAEAKCIAPSIRLRQTDVSTWQAYIELPSFAGWARVNPKINAFLSHSRCKVKGTQDVWHNRRWLIFGAPEQRILDLPPPGTSWLRFETREEETTRLIDDECRVGARPWLFQLDDDGCAVQIPWKSVKAGKNYIVVHDGDVVPNELLTPATLGVKGGVAHTLSVPPLATDVSTRCLSQLGLSAARTLKVWPAGLPPLDFGDDDVLEWSARLPLTLGIEHDETCDAFTLQFAGKTTTFKTAGRKVSFVELGKVTPGLLPISVATTYRTADGSSSLRTQASQRSFLLAVRAPIAGLSSRRHAPVLVVTPDPPNPSLDAMMSGLATCSVHGPKGRMVDFRLELMNGAGEVIHDEPLGQLELPVDRAAWKRLVKERDAADSVGEPYFRASSGQLLVNGQDIGGISIPLRHSMSPVRWHVIRAPKQVRLNVVDDTDHSEPLHAYRASFLQPSQQSMAWGSPDASCIEVTDGGGLYVATVNGHRSSIVVNAPPTKMSLADWKHSKPMLAPHLFNAQQVSELLAWIRDWTYARLIGPFSEHQRNAVLREMHRQLYATLCGVDWADSELAFKDSDGHQSIREQLESSVWKHPAFAIGLTRHAEAIVTDSLDETCKHLLDHVQPYSVCKDPRLCALALRIAMTPEGFADWAGADACKRIDEIVHHRALLKAVRLLALLLGTRGQLLARNW